MRATAFAVVTFCHALSAMAQEVPEDAKRTLLIPFSDEELFAAYRLSMSDDDARRSVQDLRKEQQRSSEALARFYRDPQRYGVDERLSAGESPAFGISLSDDTLIILSLLSEDLSQRVASYRRLIDPRSEEDEAWAQRREQLREWVRSRLRPRPDDAPP